MRTIATRWTVAAVALLALLVDSATARTEHPAASRAAHIAPGGPALALCGATGMPGRRGSPVLRTLPISNGAAVAVDARTNHVFVLRSFVSNSLGDTSAVCMLDGHDGRLLRATTIGKDALGLAVDSTTGRVFVANTIDPSVSVLDATTGALLRTVPLPDGPRVVAVDERTGRVFLTNGHQQIVSMLDARDGTLLHTTHVGSEPFALTNSASTHQIFVANFEGGSVSVLDARTGALIRTVRVGGKPQAIAIDPGTGHAFVSSQGDLPSMLNLRTGRVVRTLPVDAQPAQVTTDQRTHRVFLNILPDNGGAVSVYDTRTGNLLRTTALISYPIDRPVVDAQTGHVLMLLQSPRNSSGQTAVGPGALVSLDGMTGALRQSVNVGDVSVDESYGLIAIDAGTQRAFVSTGDAVVVLDAARL